MAKSKWYEQAVAVVRRALAEMPSGASRKDCLENVREAYPFGAREGWPYKMWCRAQRDLIGERFPDPAVAEECRANVVWSYRDVTEERHLRIRIRKIVRPPAVACPVCGVQPAGTISCLLCREMRARWASLWGWRDPAAAFQAALDDPAEASILADFLTDEFPELVSAILEFHKERQCDD